MPDYSLGEARPVVLELIRSSYVVRLEIFLILGTWSPMVACFVTALLSLRFTTTPCPRSCFWLELRPVIKWPTALPGWEALYLDRDPAGSDLSTLRFPRRVGGASVSIKICGVAFFSVTPSCLSWTRGCLAFTGSVFVALLGPGDLPEFPII